ncbi:hypothetical protein GCM10007079_15980 [Nocardiopsis terrae]|nr:hypothetical protein GCM10007079_15980 [Nocardiopsis terrae]
MSTRWGKLFRRPEGPHGSQRNTFLPVTTPRGTSREPQLRICPLTRARLIGDLLTELGDIEVALKEVRRPAVTELREQGHAGRALASELGLSPARIDQISKGKRA